jgi:putative PIN family toxin of toxin-antitoxin system
MRRVVIDTNVLVSSVIQPIGVIGELINLLKVGKFSLIYSQVMLGELVDVVNREKLRLRYGFTEDDVNTLLALVLKRGEVIIPTNEMTACRDPKDNKFLEAAVVGNADAIVSGDDDLLVLNPFRGIPAFTPADFITWLDR